MICWLRLASHRTTPEQIRAFFMALPADIIGAALSWGFCDTGVRERTYAFVQQNRHTVAEAVGQGGFTDPPCRQVTGCTESITHRRQE
jgi:hypothetical protein